MNLVSLLRLALVGRETWVECETRERPPGRKGVNSDPSGVTHQGCDTSAPLPEPATSSGNIFGS